MKINKLLLSGLMTAVLSASVFAEKISKIEYIGCQRVEAETISSYLPIQVGEEYCDETINESLKTLNSTGFFEEVRIDKKGTVLVITVKEYPIIDKISFEGNSKLSDRDINKAIRLKQRETLSPSKVKEIQQGLLDVYRKMGRYNASVNPKIIKLDNNRVNLVFEINEGDAAGIARIVFVGNKKISSSDLRDVVSSKVKRWYRFFVTDDIYDQDRLEEDKNAVAKYYHERGYANARVLSATAELTSDKKEFVITIAIDEGEIYKFGDLKVTSKIQKLDEKKLSKDFYCKKGNEYNQNLIEVDVGEISKVAGQSGFSSVKVIPEFIRDEKAKTINISYTVVEGEKVYISKIVIKGNTRTREHIIRREIPVEEGDCYNQALVNLAEGNLRGTGYFKVVNIEAIPDPNSPDKCILQVTVEETPTGEAMIAGSYSTQDGIGLDLTYNDRNFMGTGKSLGVFLGSCRARTGKSYKIDENGNATRIGRKPKFKFLNNVSVTAGDPHIFDKDMEGTISFYKYQTSKWDGFTTNELGTTLGVSYALTSRFSQSWDYTVSGRKFHDVSDYTSPIIKYQTIKIVDDKDMGKTAKNTLSSLKHTISYGRQILTGLKGAFKAGLSTSYAGIGGNARHIRNEIFGSYIIPLSRKSTVKLALSYGMLSNVGNRKVHIADSYSLGLDSFRGFDDCGFGPLSETYRRDPTEGNILYQDNIGAKKYWKGTVETAFPIGLPEELQFRGFVFSDFGTLWDAPEKGEKFLKPVEGGGNMKYKDGTDTGIPRVTCPFDNSIVNGVTAHKITDTKKIRVSVGLGISFVTPFGPLKFTYAVPVRKEKSDEPYRFLIGFSTTF